MRTVIRGAGFGHGIGLSQYGAYGYALHGRSYQAILAHYYKGTRLSTAPSRPVRVLLQPEDPYIRVQRRHPHQRPHLEALTDLHRARVGQRDRDPHHVRASAWRVWATAPVSPDAIRCGCWARP